MRLVIKHLILLGSVSILALSAQAVEFEVEGNAVLDLYAGKYPEGSYTNHFIVSVRDEEWRITTWGVGSANRLECYKDKDYLRSVRTTFVGAANTNGEWINQ